MGRDLTSRRARLRLAQAIERAVTDPLRRRSPGTAAVPVAAEEVLPVAGELLEVACLLRSDAPVSPRGIRQLWRLLTDGSGPLFYPRWRGELARRVAQAAGALRQPPASTTS